MTNRYLSILLCLTLSGCALTPSPDRQTLAAGDTLFEQGRFAQALQAWPPAEHSNLLRRAQAYQALGMLRDAQQAAQRALTQAEPQQQGKALALLADIERLRGFTASALAHLQQAKPYGLEDSRLAVQLALLEGRLALQAKQNEQALTHFDRAQPLAAALGDGLLQQEVAVQIWALRGRLSADGQAWSADDLKAQRATVGAVLALPASAGKDFLALELAHLLLTIPEQADQAEALLIAAEAGCRRRQDQRLLSYALGYRGSLAEQRQQDAEALAWSGQAAFAAQQAGAPESLYRWEWQTARLQQRAHRDTEALAAYRRALFNLQSVRSDIDTGGAFADQVAPLFAGFSDLLLQQARLSEDAATRQRLLREARNTLEQLKAAELQDYFQDRCVANFKAKSVGLENIAPGTAVLYPVLLPDRTELLIGFADGLQQFIVPIGRAELNREIHAFRSLLEKRTTYQYLYPARRLYQWLIAPLLPELRQRNIDTLVVVPDGALRTIPLAALNDGQHYLIETFSVATTPGLALTDPHPLPKQALPVLLNGITESVQQFPALPDVAQELDNIHRQLGGTLLKDEAFLLPAFEQAMENQPYRIVHIASHGQFDSNPNKTFLLTYDNKLTMNLLERYIAAGKFRDQPVELLTLSACQTAAGDDRAALGLAGVAVKAGARSALATLWFVNDQASSQLVSAFYRQLQQHHSKAAALQEAQLELLHDPRYRHAGYWAPFLIIGNWL